MAWLSAIRNGLASIAYIEAIAKQIPCNYVLMESCNAFETDNEN